MSAWEVAESYALLFATGFGLAALLTACTPLGPDDFEPGTMPIEIPLAGDQYGPCLDDEPRCWGIGECTEEVEGITMCSAQADVCPPMVLGEVTLPTTAVFNGTGKCVVLCEADEDCYPGVGLVCGGEVCGWE